MTSQAQTMTPWMENLNNKIRNSKLKYPSMWINWVSLKWRQRFLHHHDPRIVYYILQLPPPFSTELCSVINDGTVLRIKHHISHLAVCSNNKFSRVFVMGVVCLQPPWVGSEVRKKGV